MISFLCKLKSDSSIFTARKRSLGQGNVFEGVCLSAGVLRMHHRSHDEGWGSASREGGLHPRGGGVLPTGRGVEQTAPPPGIRKADGTHPTGTLPW